jgi:hypothetical protein
MAGAVKTIARLDVTTNTSIVTFSSIPQGYTDLILRWTGVQSGGGNDDLRINFNSSVQSIYFNNQLYLSNSAYAGNNASSTYGTVGYIIGTNYSNFTNTSGQVYIFD